MLRTTPTILEVIQVAIATIRIAEVLITRVVLQIQATALTDLALQTAREVITTVVAAEQEVTIAVEAAVEVAEAVVAVEVVAAEVLVNRLS